MARNSSTITVELVGDADKLRRTLKRTEDDLGGFGSKAKRYGVAIGKAIAVAGAAVAAGGVIVGKALFDTGTQLEAIRNKSQTVFGDQIGVVRKWAEANANAMGLTRNAAVGLAANFGDLLIPMGFTREEAAKMSTDVVGLSGALSEWSGGTRSAAEVSQILAKAMLGERDSLKELGISITEADVQQRLMEKGQKDLTGAALEQAKAIATQELIFEKSTDAQAAYAEGANKLQRTQNELRARFGEMREELAQKALPIMLRVAEWAGKNLPAALDTAMQFAEQWGPRVGAVFSAVGEFVADLIKRGQQVVEWWQEHFSRTGSVASSTEGMRSQLADIWDQIKGVIKSVTDAVVAIVKVFIKVAQDLWERFGRHILDFAARTWDNIMRVISGVLDVIRGIFDVFAGLFTGDWRRMWDGVKTILAGLWRAMEGVVRFAIDTIRTIIGLAVAKISSAWSLAWNAIKTFLSAIWTGITRTVREKADEVRERIAEALSRIRARWEEAWNRAREFVLDAFTQIRTGVVKRADQLLDWFRELPGRIVRAIGNLGSTLVDAGKDLVSGLLRGIRSSAVNIWDAINPFGDGPGIGAVDPGRWRGQPMQVRQMMGMINSAFPGTNLISGLRPGARTSTGNVSYHARGRAVDFPPVRRIAEWINRNFMGRTRELITPWQDLNIHNGRRHRYSSGIMALHTGRMAHNHWAMATGAYMKRPVTFERVTMAERHPEVVAPEPMLRRIVREETGQGGVTINGPITVVANDPQSFIGELRSLAHAVRAA